MVMIACGSGKKFNNHAILRKFKSFRFYKCFVLNKVRKYSEKHVFSVARTRAYFSKTRAEFRHAVKRAHFLARVTALNESN